MLAYTHNKYRDIYTYTYSYSYTYTYICIILCFMYMCVYICIYIHITRMSFNYNQPWAEKKLTRALSHKRTNKNKSLVRKECVTVTSRIFRACNDVLNNSYK